VANHLCLLFHIVFNFIYLFILFIYLSFYLVELYVEFFHCCYCIKNGMRTAASKSITLQLYQWEKKPRKTTEEMDGQCKRRYRSKEVECTTSNGSGVGQKQMETSSSSLIIIEMMEESRRRSYWNINSGLLV